MASNNVPLPVPPLFIRKNYKRWAMKMRGQLKAYDLSEVVETVEPPALEENPIVAQISFRSELVAKRANGHTILHSVMNDDVFIRISNLDTTKEI